MFIMHKTVLCNSLKQEENQMKKLVALLMTLVMVLAAVSFAGAESVDAANIVESPEFQVMTLGNYKYGEDYTSLYEKYGKDITIADVTEDEETGFAVETVYHPLELPAARSAPVQQRILRPVQRADQGRC